MRQDSDGTEKMEEIEGVVETERLVRQGTQKTEETGGCVRWGMGTGEMEGMEETGDTERKDNMKGMEETVEWIRWDTRGTGEMEETGGQ